MGVRTGMMREVMAVAVLAWATNAAAVELKNDSFIAGASVAYQAGFVSGEAGATKLTSPYANGKVQAIRLLFGGATSMQTVTLTIFEDSAGTSPGAVIYTGDFSITGANDTMQELDLSTENVSVGTAFRVAITFQHAGAPSIATDTDGLNANLNFLLLQGTGWVGASTVGLSGDWVIRAVVEDNTPDAGVDAGLPDAGLPDAGEPDAGSTDAGTVDAGGSADAGVDAGFDAGSGSDAGPSSGMCTANTDCAVGNYCDLTTRRCTFDCRAAADCGSNMTCSSLGKCVGDSKPTGCGCTSLEWAAAAAAVVLLARRRRR